MLIVAIFLAAMTVIIFTSCGDSSSSDTTPAGHKVTAEESEKIVADTTEDLNLIDSVETDTAVLATAMTGKGLNEMKTAIEKDLAAGKIKKRDYRNISAEFVQLDIPYAEVLAEFDDFSYYVDAKTGATLSQPAGTHMRFAMALVEEDGRWKIQGVFAPSTPETPRQMPQTTGTTGVTP